MKHFDVGIVRIQRPVHRQPLPVARQRDVPSDPIVGVVSVDGVAVRGPFFRGGREAVDVGDSGVFGGGVVGEVTGGVAVGGADGEGLAVAGEGDGVAEEFVGGGAVEGGADLGDGVGGW